MYSQTFIKWQMNIRVSSLSKGKLIKSCFGTFEILEMPIYRKKQQFYKVRIVNKKSRLHKLKTPMRVRVILCDDFGKLSNQMYNLVQFDICTKQFKGHNSLLGHEMHEVRVQ